jgi:Holliday junction resolvase
MVFRSKQKGNTFEKDVVDLLNSKIIGANFRRIPGSGAIGTTMDEPLLTGDVSGKVDGISERFKVECKVGYNTSTNKEVKQFTLKKEWVDKIMTEARDALSIPLLIGKFSGARKGVKEFVVIDIDTFSGIINELARLQKELDK